MPDNCMICDSDQLYESFDGPVICGECEASHVQGHYGEWFVTSAETIEACERAEAIVPDEFDVERTVPV